MSSIRRILNLEHWHLNTDIHMEHYKIWRYGKFGYLNIWIMH